MDGITAGWLGGLVGSVIGVLGGALGTYFSIKNTAGPMEKAFMVKFAAIGWIGIAAFLSLLFVLARPYNFLLWVSYGILLPICIVYCNRRLQQIRQLESIDDQPQG